MKKLYEKEITRNKDYKKQNIILKRYYTKKRLYERDIT